ncbi:MAG: RIP metalloprotease RseP [Gammaproteobacteria bacterium]|nr:RIP metalloprotease RseP [Gammaproteobacteria bacterium]
MSVLVSVTAFLVAIGVLVAVHEYGHYIAARWLGVKVLRYSIGFGKPLWTRRSGPDSTEYCVSAIPFGGYVKLLDERDCAVSFSEQDRAFNRQPIASRVVILAAGPLLNFLFAIAAYWAMFVIGVPGLRPLVGEVEPGSIAGRAGLLAGDQIIRVGDTDTTTLQAAVVAILDELLAAERIGMTVRGERGDTRVLSLDVAGRAAELTEPGVLFEGLGFDTWSPQIPPVIGKVLPGGTAERAGLLAGDTVISADGEPVATWPQWVRFVRDRPGRMIELVVERDGNRIEVMLPVERSSEDGETIGRIGAGPQVPDDLAQALQDVERYGPLDGLGQALLRTWEMSSLTLRMIFRMITGDVSVKNISGPINIAQYAGYSASIGLTSFLSFLAIVSISLGVLNLLPVPMLDGGQILFQLVEAVKGEPLSERSQLLGQQVGIVLLLALMSYAFYNDIARLLG